jgi:hypothetical protein
MGLDYFNNSGEKSIAAGLSARVDRKLVRLTGMEVEFFIILDTIQTKLGSAQTDGKGQAKFILPPDLKPLDGIYVFKAVFKGNDTYQLAEREIEIKDLFMNISFSQENENKKINVEVAEIGDGGNLIPLSEELVKFYVPRTFTLLPIGEGTLSGGVTVLDFPTDLPGDTLGYLSVVAQIEDHDMYGNVLVVESINWGKPVPLMKVEKRGLGDTNAPLWMVYTLIVLLSTVWLHYFYSIYAIYMINEEGKKVGISLD